MPSPVTPILLGLLFSSLQDTRQGSRPSLPRERLLGRAVQLDGKPWPDAEVTLVHRPVAWCEIGEADIVVVRSNADGDFRAEVLAEREYSAFARAAGGKEGPRASTVLEGAGAGRFALVREAPRPVNREQIRVEALDPWKHRMPLRVRAVVPSRNVHSVELEVAKDGTMALPALPVPVEGHRWLEFFGSDGVPLHFHRLSSTLETVELPPPLRLPVKVCDLETKKPIAGARVSFWFEFTPLHHRVARWCEGQRTDAEGRVLLEVARKGEDLSTPGFHVFVEAPGYVTGLSGWASSGPFADGVFLGEPPEELVFDMRRGAAERGRLLVRDGEPAAGLELVVWTRFNVSQGEGSTYVINAAPIVCRTDAEGFFETPAVGRYAERERLQLLVDSRAMAAIRTVFPDVDRLPALVSPATPRRLDEKGRSTFALASLKEARFVVRGEGPEPVQGARVYLFSKREGLRHSIELLGCAPTPDAHGRFQLLLAPGQYLVAVTTPADGYAMVPVEVGEKAGGARVLEVKLLPYAAFTGSVTTADDEPVPGALLRRGAIRTQWSKDTKEDVPVIAELNGALLHGVADERGRFRLLFIPSAHVLVAVRARAPHRGTQESAEVTIGADSVEDHVFVLGR